jgi:hypothetical protein
MASEMREWELGAARDKANLELLPHHTPGQRLIPLLHHEFHPVILF